MYGRLDRMLIYLCIGASSGCALQKVAGANVSNEVKNVLKEVDRNGDGRIDYEEFCDMMRQVGSACTQDGSAQPMCACFL